MVEDVLELSSKIVGKGSASQIWNKMGNLAVANGGWNLASAGSGPTDC
jgi:hypothetical protein